MGDAPFDAEKNSLVRDPAKAATDAGPFVVTPARADKPAGRDPANTPPFSTLRVRSRYEIDDMIGYARASTTFKNAEAALKKDGVTIDWNVGRLPDDKGGGSTRPGQYAKSYEVTLDPETVRPGYHIFDTFLHEYGHVIELSKGTKSRIEEGKHVLAFMNAVQTELGLRTTPDSHE